MQIGDRLLLRNRSYKKVYIVAKVDIPHSTERAFVSKSGGDFTIGFKVWKADYVWSPNSQMWVPKR